MIGARRRGSGSRAIDAIEGRNADGSTFLLPASQVMAHIESGRFAFYVGGSGNARAYLRIVRRRNGRRYLRTVADSASPNNLGRLPTYDGRRVPTLVGMPLAEAVAAVTAAELVASNVQHRFDARPIDEVIVQRPSAGVEVSRGSAVQIIASDGPAATVPRVIGLGLAAATGSIEAAALIVGSALRRFDVRPKDEVLEQSPIGGTLVRRGSRVGMTVSDGPAAVVPNLVGQPLSAAAGLLAAAQLTAGAVLRRFDLSPLDTVIEQQPAALTIVRPATEVGLVVSDGPSAVVPLVVGQPLANARSSILSVGLVVGTEQRRSDPAALDTVVEQQPSAGSAVKPGTAVGLVVSNGPSAVVPQLVGQSLAAARTAITAAGLATGTVARQINAKPKDEVLAQQPAAGAQVALGSSVALSVSDAAGSLVPNVMGLTESAASQAIINAGLFAFVAFRVPSLQNPLDGLLVSGPPPASMQ